MLIKRKAHSIVGIDISSTAVKVLELSCSGAGYHVQSYGLAPVPAGAFVENDIKDLNAVSEVVSMAVSRAKPKSNFVALAVPTSSVITKELSIEATLSEAEMEAQVALEAKQFVPYPLDEVSLDFNVLGLNQKDPAKVDVLVAASRRENVDIRVEAIEPSGLTVDIVDVESFAIERALRLISPQLPDEGVNKTIAIIDFGATMTTLTVLHNLRAVYSREEVFGGRQLTEAIQRRYNLSFEEAGRAKKEGGLPEDYEQEVLGPFRESLIPLVRRSLQFFYSSGQYAEIDYYVLAGGGAQISGLSSMITERLGAPCTVANPFKDMTIASNIDPKHLYDDAAALMVCCGLALRSFDQ